MRVLFFHPLTGRYHRGIERNVIDLASCMAQRGHQVSILTLRYAEDALLAELDPRVRIYRTPQSPYYSHAIAVPFYIAHLLRHDYDAIIVFFGGFGIGPALAAVGRVRPLPIFIYLGYPASLVPHRYAEFEWWRLPGVARGIWAQGEHVTEEAARRFGRPVTPLPTGVRPERFRPDAEVRRRVRAGLGVGPDTLLVLTVAALEERKGVQHVIAAWPGVHAALPNARYVVIGDGIYKEELERMARALQVSNVVRLLPATEQVERYYAAADVFCLLTLGEAGPITIYEALAAETPVIALREPHLAAHLGPDVAELLPSTEPDLVATALLKLLRDPVRRQQMGEAGGTLVRERYTLQSLTDLVCTLVDDAGTAHPLRRRVAV